MTDNYQEKYTKPDLRRQIKEELMASDQGGKPGQWSARKSQRLVQEYEKQGGDYKEDDKDAAAKSLEAWGQQHWQTESGEERARQGDKTKRYLPEAVWNRLSGAEKQEAEQTKEAASRTGQQHVDWTPAIKRAMKAAGYAETSDSQAELSHQDLYERARELNVHNRSKINDEQLRDAIRDQS